MDLTEGELLSICCPACGAALPVYGDCSCGGKLIVMFTGQPGDFNNCAGVCNRVGCLHAEIKTEGQMLSLSAYEIY